MATYRYVCYDILTTFKQVLDDSEITLNHVLYWVVVIMNRLNKLHKEKHDTGLHLTIFDSVSVTVDTTLKDRKYIELPAAIFDLDYEKAVDYITYNYEKADSKEPNFTQVKFQAITASKADRLYYSPYESPCPTKPYFYRVRNRLYFLGIEEITVPTVEIGLFTAVDPALVVDLDSEIPLPDDLVQILVYEVRNLGRLSLLLPKDRVNEGTDVTTEEPPPKEAQRPEQPILPQQTEQ